MTDLAARQHAAAVDAESAARLAARGLDLRLVDTDAERDAYSQVVARGFLDTERSTEQLDAVRERSAYRRLVGVYDVAAPVPDAPVGTIAGWVAELSVPGGATVPSLAVSAVTVAPTHRRRGIARALVEGELRTAASLGVPVASLTVSESPLYGRYGFAAAAAVTSWRIDPQRAGWVAPDPAGRVDFVPRERWRELAPALHERVRPGVPGELAAPAALWDTLAGTRPDAKDAAKIRAVQHTDADGVVRGLLVYTVDENPDDYARSTATVSYLLAETPDAYAALWRFVLDLDLIGEVRASELSVDEPLLWMLADQRAAHVEVVDHHYVRVLDVPVALAARRYGAPGVLALDVTDPLGIAAGHWLLTVGDDGRGTVEERSSDDVPAGAVRVALGVTELSAAYLGGVSVATLAAAGRVHTSGTGGAQRAAQMLGWHDAPRLTYWY
ncbi:GNAT family N-acetyltransferase [Luteimicrobium subarcticum]|uniref:Putative acetyltransferase n=1 Tax=Luteimicrobium subarcticum TaxID=620910 RepID=A0A2M8WSB5_9MICO|nr:GNAT family N-acetyltransferase [Luteimicrobium subarcticum]PJI93774.1 putative acetyltransferase [Luteimicrobium subarcticum]